MSEIYVVRDLTVASNLDMVSHVLKCKLSTILHPSQHRYQWHIITRFIEDSLPEIYVS